MAPADSSGVDLREPPLHAKSAAADELLWIALVAALMVIPNLFAVQQYWATRGWLFYSNAFDEPTYLSYDGAMMTRSLTHLGEYLVVALHRAGLSGGLINLVLDLTLSVLALFVLRALAASLGFSRLEAIVYPSLVIASPVLFGYANPYYTRLYNLNYYSAGLKWITLPQGYYPPFFRSPEPQLSLCVAGLAAYAAVRARSYWPPLVVAPFLYPFVGVPFAFVAFCLLLEDMLATRVTANRPGVVALIGYLAVALAIGGYYVVFIRSTGLADFFPHSRLPFVSGTGAAALLVYLLVRRRLEPGLRAPALFLALAPTVAVNTQIVSGFFETPHNFEQNFGVVALAILFVFALRALGAGRWLLCSVAAASCVLLMVYSAQVFGVNGSLWQRLPISPALIEALRQDAGSVVISDPDLADIFSLIAPRVHFSALARSQTLRSDGRSAGEMSTKERFERYLCTKRLIQQHDLSDVVPADSLAILDHGFQYMGHDFPLVHLNRERKIIPYFDLASTPAHCESHPLIVFPSLIVGAPMAGVELLSELTSAGRWAHSATAATVLTPQAQWAYAAMARLPGSAVTTDNPSGRLLDVRAHLTVDVGCLGIGVLTHDQRRFVHEIAVTTIGTATTADVVFEWDPRGHWVVVQNCSPAGASKARIDKIEMRGVRAVTVRTVPADTQTFFH